VATFGRQFDAHSDRGNADFDQRHNLVCFSIWEPGARARWPVIFRGWRISHLAGFRSGLPYSVHAASAVPESGGSVFNNRADVIHPHAVAMTGEAAGGRRLLNPAAFAQPLNGQLGNLGRNALSAPGFFNVDVSLARSFFLGRLGESGALVIRADVFNLLNHANLDAPDNVLHSPTFGIARYGRRGVTRDFPALTPFAETSRQVQLLIRILF
jgi:hypothetical protein